MNDETEDPRVQDGVEHLQRAAREMISASRAFLDIVEELVERPGAASDLLALLGTVGDQVRKSVKIPGRPGAGHDPFASHDAFADDIDDDDDPDGDDGPVQRIPVS